MENLSLLSKCPPPRPLPIALAHCFAACKLADETRLALLNRLYAKLSFAEAFQCRRELLECRHARSEGKLAAVRA